MNYIFKRAGTSPGIFSLSLEPFFELALAYVDEISRRRVSTQSRNVLFSAILKCPPWVVGRGTFVNS